MTNDEQDQLNDPPSDAAAVYDAIPRPSTMRLEPLHSEPPTTADE